MVVTGKYILKTSVSFGACVTATIDDLKLTYSFKLVGVSGVGREL